MRTQGKKLNKPLLIVAALFALVFTSCSVDDVDSTTLNNKERIDLVIEGDISNAVFEENSDLVTYAATSNHILNPEEYVISINLGNSHRLDLSIYNKNLSNPLEQPFQYSGFSLDLLSSKFAYVIGEYYINDIKTYSSSSSVLAAYSQLNVLKASDKGQNYLLSLNDFNLFELFDEGSRFPYNSVKIDGTFTLLK